MSCAGAAAGTANGIEPAIQGALVHDRTVAGCGVGVLVHAGSGHRVKWMTLRDNGGDGFDCESDVGGTSSTGTPRPTTAVRDSLPKPTTP